MLNNTNGLLTDKQIKYITDWLNVLQSFEGDEDRAFNEYTTYYNDNAIVLSDVYPEGWRLVENKIDLSHSSYGDRERTMEIVVTDDTNYVRILTDENLSWGDLTVVSADLVTKHTETVEVNTWKKLND